MVRRFLALLFATMLAAPAAWAAPRNIVLVVADDLGLDLGCYGNSVIKTPNLDALAADGTLFTHAFATTASCSPSRSVILTGLHNHTNGQYGLQHADHHFASFDSVKSLPSRLHEANYRTVRIGKFHVAPDAVYPFETVLKGDPRNGVQMADRCRDIIAAKDDRPFFLYFCVTDPHRSGGAKHGKEPNPFGNDARHPGVNEVKYDPKSVVVPPFLPDTPTSRAELAEYYQSVSRVDAGVGRLIQVLKDSGHWDDTLLLFISDNGIPFPGAKTTTYDAGLRLPCLVRNPYSSQRGVRCDAMISWVDIAPTILKFAGAAKIKQDARGGRSFLDILGEPRPEGRDEIFASHTFHEATMYYPMRVARNRKYKLIWNVAHGLPFPFASDLWGSSTWQEALAAGPQSRYGRRTVKQYVERPRFELYDIESDPHEAKNLADDPQHASVLSELQGRIKAEQERTQDPWLLKWDRE